MSDQGQDKNQQATPHRLREAQKRGQVAKSNEVTYAAVLAVAIMVFYSMGPSIARHFAESAALLLRSAGRADWGVDQMARWITSSFAQTLVSLAPLVLGIVCAAVAANVAQTGGVFSFEPIKPDFSKLNPANGFQKLFSIRSLYESFRSIAKLVLLGFVLWSALTKLLPQLLMLHYLDAKMDGIKALAAIGPLCVKLLMAIALIALVDLIYTRWDYAKRMRMSHRDIADEHKQREGDPRIRSRLRQLRNEFLKKTKAIGKVPEADVLITNPTHIAIALSYKHGEMPAPKLLAKGKGSLAAKMRSVARQHNIPVVENPPLARELFKRADFDDFVPEDLYPKIAKILIWVYAMRKERHTTRSASARLSA